MWDMHDVNLEYWDKQKEMNIFLSTIVTVKCYKKNTFISFMGKFYINKTYIHKSEVLIMVILRGKYGAQL
jgi:hypothetical protein